VPEGRGLLRRSIGGRRWRVHSTRRALSYSRIMFEESRLRQCSRAMQRAGISFWIEWVSISDVPNLNFRTRPRATFSPVTRIALVNESAWSFDLWNVSCADAGRPGVEKCGNLFDRFVKWRLHKLARTDRAPPILDGLRQSDDACAFPFGA
jgi:hypothetical protein